MNSDLSLSFLKTVITSLAFLMLIFLLTGED